MDLNVRRKGIRSLFTLLKSQRNVIAFERKALNESDNDSEKYLENIYYLVGSIINNTSLNATIKIPLGYDHPSYDACKKKIAEEDDFANNPFEITEGLLTCKKCGDDKVFYVSAQERSADEGQSTRATCIKCGQKWVLRG